MLLHSLEDLLNVLQILNPILDEDEDIIQIYDHKRIDEGPQNVIHHPHESWWIISQSKRHDQPLKKTFLALKGSFLDISFLNWYLVVGQLQINLPKILAPLELVKKIINPWNWIPIPKYDFVESFRIRKHAPMTFLF